MSIPSPGPTHSPSQFIWASLSLGLKWPGMNLTTHLQLAPRLRMSGPILLFPLYAFMAWAGTVVLGFTVKQFHRSSDCVRVRRIYRTQALPFFSEDRKLHSCRNVVFYCKTYLMKNIYDIEINSYFISISFKVCILFTKPICLVQYFNIYKVFCHWLSTFLSTLL